MYVDSAAVDGLMPMIPIATSEPKVPSNAPKEQHDCIAPDLTSTAGRESAPQDQREREDWGTVTNQLPETPVEHVSNRNLVGGDTHEIVQSRSGGECQRSSGLPAFIDIYWVWKEKGLTEPFCPPCLLATRLHVDSVLSEPF